MSELTHEELTRLLDYDPETGVFRWKVAMGSRVNAGSVAGHKSERARQIDVKGKRYSTRRLAWFFVNQEFPRNNLFVKNGDQFDDRIENIGMLPDKPTELTQGYLKECIDYNPQTGDFKWKINDGRGHYKNDAFYIDNKGNNYIGLQTKILGHRYSTMRLIVFWMTGYLPSKKRLVMPIDNNVLNLKWDNIKVGDWSEARIKSRAHGKSSMKGVHLKKTHKKYAASIHVNGKQKHLGYFPTEAEAHAAYMKAARKHYGALANDGYQHAMYEMEYEEVERPVDTVIPEPDLDEDIKVAAQEVKDIIDREIEPVIHHPDDF